MSDSKIIREKFRALEELFDERTKGYGRQQKRELLVGAESQRSLKQLECHEQQ